MGLIGQQLSRAVPVQRARTGAASTAAMSATASGLTANRRERPSGAQLYRSWAVHGELVRAALDVKIGQLTKAEWDLVPFDRTGRTPDVGLMNRMKEILMQPNPGEDGLDTFFQQLGEDLFTLDAAPFEKERLVRGEVIWLWPVDGNHIGVDKLWNGDPNMPRYFYQPAVDVNVPFRNTDMGYIKMHHRTNSVMGIPPLETLKHAVTAELNGSMYNDKQVTQAAPDGIMDLGENARPDQVESFKALWNTLIAGKSMMAFWGGTKSAKFIPFKNNNRDMQFIEWQEYLVRKICAVLHLSPQDLGFSFDINKSTGEVQQAMTDDRTLFPLARVQNVMTSQFCWDPAWGGPSNNIAFRFTAVTDRQSKALAETQKLTLAGMPSETVNEARRRQGKSPMGDPNSEENPYNKLMANTPQGLVLLEDIPTARELAMRKVPKPGETAGPPATTKLLIEKAFEAQPDLVEMIKALPTPQTPDVSVTGPTINMPEIKIPDVKVDVLPPDVKVDVAPPEIKVEAPIVNVSPPEVNVAVDTTDFVRALDELRAGLEHVQRPIVRREVIRDANGRITEVVDHREEE